MQLGALVDVVLLGREAEPMELRSPADRPVRAQVLERPDRLAFLDELLVGQVAQVVVAPPERLGLATVPGEELGEEPASVLLGRPVGLVGGDAVAEPVRERLDAGESLAQLLAGLGRFGERPGKGHALASLQLTPTRLEPVAQAPVGEAVVAVVAGDPGEGLGIAAGLAALLEPRLEGHDATTPHRAGRSRG